MEKILMKSNPETPFNMETKIFLIVAVVTLLLLGLIPWEKLYKEAKEKKVLSFFENMKAGDKCKYFSIEGELRKGKITQVNEFTVLVEDSGGNRQVLFKEEVRPRFFCDFNIKRSEND